MLSGCAFMLCDVHHRRREVFRLCCLFFVGDFTLIMKQKKKATNSVHWKNINNKTVARFSLKEFFLFLIFVVFFATQYRHTCADVCADLMHSVRYF